MSAAASTADHAHSDGKFHVFVQLAMILAVITGIEIVAVFFPWAKWILVSGLIALSVLKFMLVIFIFMHLKWDKVFCTILFFIGLVLAAGTMWALLALFGAEESKRVDPNAYLLPTPAHVQLV